MCEYPKLEDFYHLLKDDHYYSTYSSYIICWKPINKNKKITDKLNDIINDIIIYEDYATYVFEEMQIINIIDIENLYAEHLTIENAMFDVSNKISMVRNYFVSMKEKNVECYKSFKRAYYEAMHNSHHMSHFTGTIVLYHLNGAKSFDCCYENGLRNGEQFNYSYYELPIKYTCWKNNELLYTNEFLPKT
uniref:Uncharacterized protein n=1 Tax=viral metagenome TaxID=1070528 RepID=A0A6C0EB07_9ZZZZ